MSDYCDLMSFQQTTVTVEVGNKSIARLQASVRALECYQHTSS